MLRVLQATLRGPASPLLQVHPDRWYPSVGAWASREGRPGRLGRTSGRQLLGRCLLLQPLWCLRFMGKDFTEIAMISFARRLVSTFTMA